jgi:hypothetical protein
VRKTPVEHRFWDKVDVRGPEDCWPWLAAVSPNGYGRVKADQRSAYAHRVAVSLTTGVPLDELGELDHRCENRRCVNPAHLDEVTHAQNMELASW